MLFVIFQIVNENKVSARAKLRKKGLCPKHVPSMGFRRRKQKLAFDRFRFGPEGAVLAQSAPDAVQSRIEPNCREVAKA